MSNYADPHVKFTLEYVSVLNMKFLIIKVSQFEDFPIICKRTFQVGKEFVLQEGAIYSRTRRKPESSKVMTSPDLREILELATDKAVKRFVRRANAAGLFEIGTLSDKALDDRQFDSEMEDLR